jgi:hypothetical protein
VFSNNENLQNLGDQETKGEALVAEVISAAKGVFRWVFLDIRSFQEGCPDKHRILLFDARDRNWTGSKLTFE